MFHDTSEAQRLVNSKREVLNDCASTRVRGVSSQSFNPQTWASVVSCPSVPNGALDAEPRSLTALEASRTPQIWIVLLTAIGGLAGLRGWVLVPVGSLALLIAAWPRLSGIRASTTNHQVKRRWLLDLVQVLSNQILAAILAFLAGRLQVLKRHNVVNAGSKRRSMARRGWPTSCPHVEATFVMANGA